MPQNNHTDTSKPGRIVSCPQCKKAMQWNRDNPWRPFCSERCRLIDLGDWANEKNAIPAEESEDWQE